MKEGKRAMSGSFSSTGNKNEEEQQQGECSHNYTTNPNLPLLHPQMHHPQSTNPFLPLAGAGGGSLAGLITPPPPHFYHHHHHEVSDILPWSLPPPPFNPTRDYDPFLCPPSSSDYSSSSTAYACLFGRRPHPSAFGYDGPSSSSDPLRILSEALGPLGQPGGAPLGLQVQAELRRMTAQDIMDAKALAASKSHNEAERRRRERINHHLAKLRSLLPSTTKSDKASLLAEVIQHVKELKRQTSAIAETGSIPTEADELAVDVASDVDSDGRLVIKASLCCDDRTDLLPDLIKALKALRLKTLKAEITTLGGRVKNVLFATGKDICSDGGGESSTGGEQWSISSIQEALRAVMEKSGGSSNGGRDDSANGNAKRQRTNTNVNIGDHQYHVEGGR